MKEALNRTRATQRTSYVNFDSNFKVDKNEMRWKYVFLVHFNKYLFILLCCNFLNNESNVWLSLRFGYSPEVWAKYKIFDCILWNTCFYRKIFKLIDYLHSSISWIDLLMKSMSSKRSIDSHVIRHQVIKSW